MISGHYVPQCSHERLAKSEIRSSCMESYAIIIYFKSHAKCNYVKVESVRTLLNITRLLRSQYIW